MIIATRQLVNLGVASFTIDARQPMHKLLLGSVNKDLHG